MEIGKKEITLTHLNIRQSISILLGKLVFIDVIAAILVIAIYFGIVTGGDFLNFTYQNNFLFLGLFVLVGIIKLVLDAYAILVWLNEYYEITPEYVISKKGIIFKQEEKHRVDNIRSIDISRSLLGELLNFGTITLYDNRMHKDLDMNFVHNPIRYCEVLCKINERIERKEDKLRKGYHEEVEAES
jgi:membrane protein YdbS with pleckstrin-like domain